MCVVPKRCLVARFTICMKNLWGWKSDEIKSLGRTRQPTCSLGGKRKEEKEERNEAGDSSGRKLLEHEVITEMCLLVFSPLTCPDAWISRQSCVRCSNMEALGCNRPTSEVGTCWCLGPGCLMLWLLPDSRDGPSSNSTWRGQWLHPHQSQAITQVFTLAPVWMT